MKMRARKQKWLNSLAAQFLQRTAGDMTSLREFLAQLRSGDARALKSLRNLAHNIHGTGATLGFPSIGDCAGKLERLAAGATVDNPLDPQVIERLADSASRLESEVERAIETRGLRSRILD